MTRSVNESKIKDQDFLILKLGVKYHGLSLE